MTHFFSPIYHAALIGAGAAKHDVEDGSVDVWNIVKPEFEPKFINPVVSVDDRGIHMYYFEISKYAEIIAANYSTMASVIGLDDLDEVYDKSFSQEVSMAFGEWFALYVIENHDAPPANVALNKIAELIKEYMTFPDDSE